MNKTIEQQYTEIDDTSHVILRPDMYIGSVVPSTETVFVFDESNFEKKEIEYTAGMLKLVDEIISNSVDEHKRCIKRRNELITKSKQNVHILNYIDVNVSVDGLVVVRDNGGIPIEYHNDAKCYVPQMIFGRLRAGSNFDDTDNRNGVGRNGVGSSLANILSTSFNISTCHGKANNKKQCSKNMKIVGNPNIIVDKNVKNVYPTKGVVINKGMKIESELTVNLSKGTLPERHTETSFKIDMKMFPQEDGISYGLMKMIERKCIISSASNSELIVRFNGTEYDIKSFDEYVKLYGHENIISGSTDQWEYVIAPTDSFKGNYNLSLVNGAECNDGEHVSNANFIIRNHIKSFMELKHKMKFTNENISSQYVLYLNVKVINPIYESQTKEKLETDRKNFDGNNSGAPTISNQVLTLLEKSKIIDNLIEYHNDAKQLNDIKENKKKDLTNKTKSLHSITKFIDATSTRDRKNCDLWLFEGDSASNTFRSVRRQKTTGSYTLKGKLKNLWGKTKTEISKNEVLNDIVMISGLKYNSETDIKKLRFGRFIIAVDADVDGICICAQIIAFYDEHYPEIIENGMLYAVQSPLYKLYKGKNVEYFYTQDEFNKANKSGKNVEYFKGLGSLGKDEYREMVANPRLIRFIKDDNASDTIAVWMNKKDSQARKDSLVE